VHEGRFLGAASRLDLDTIHTPLIFPVVIGEVCYHLRSALDYLVYELAINDSGKAQEHTQFPIVDSPNEFGGAANRNLRGLNAAHIATIERLQPYNGCEWTKILRGLSNRDKHRHLTLTASLTMGHVQFWPTPPIVSQGPVRRARFRGIEVYVQYPFSISVLFKDGGPVVKTLRVLQAEIASTLEAFKPEFK